MPVRSCRCLMSRLAGVAPSAGFGSALRCVATSGDLILLGYQAPHRTPRYEADVLGATRHRTRVPQPAWLSSVPLVMEISMGSVTASAQAFVAQVFRVGSWRAELPPPTSFSLEGARAMSELVLEHPAVRGDGRPDMQLRLFGPTDDDGLEVLRDTRSAT